MSSEKVFWAYSIGWHERCKACSHWQGDRTDFYKPSICSNLMSDEHDKEMYPSGTCPKWTEMSESEQNAALAEAMEEVNAEILKNTVKPKPGDKMFLHPPEDEIEEMLRGD